jgi:hypothetical protein
VEKYIKDAIQLLSEKIIQEIKPDDALKFTQAALNLAHTARLLFEVDG